MSTRIARTWPGRFGGRGVLGLALAAPLFAVALLPAQAPTVGAQCDPAVESCGSIAGIRGQQYDSDWDGASDSTESYFGTDVDNPDTDGDGILDGDEYNDYYGRSDPTLYDTDYDGLGDGYEVFTSSTDPQLYDTDADGVGDGDDPDPLNPFR